MPELIVDFITSLDGYGAGEGWPGYWGVESQDYLAWLATQPSSTALMGATTYRLLSGFAADGEPGLDDLTERQKIVFSSTLTEPLSWANSRLVSGDAVETVRQLKESGSEPLCTIGSMSLCRTLLSAGLADRFRVVVFPFITGATGRERIYDGYPDLALDVVESRTFDPGLQLLDYVPRLLDGPPGVSGP